MKDFELKKIYIDMDDVIINTSETLIKHYCRQTGINKNFKDLKDFNFKSIDRKIDKKKLFEYSETDDFWNEVEINPSFLNFYNKHCYDYEWFIVTKGSDITLRKKLDFLHNKLDDVMSLNFIGLLLDEDKSKVNMKDGIQIDDEYKNLKSNAKYKVLLKNNIDTDYNKVYDAVDNLYIVNTFDEVIDCVKWLFKKI